MKKLCELVDIVANNENCVVFKPKDDVRMELISLGCFRGNEELIRMSKGRTPEITVFYKDGSTYSYHFGEGSTTLVSGSFVQQREMIRECAILDYGIVCDWSHMRADKEYDALVRETSNIRSMEDAERHVTLVSGGGMSGNILINEQGMALNVNVRDIPDWFKDRGYMVEFEQPIQNGLPCGKVYGYCEPTKDMLRTVDETIKAATGRAGMSNELNPGLDMEVEPEIE